MEHFTFEWEDRVHMRRITLKWIMKLVVWSVIVAYLPNIIWYIVGYPADAVFMQLLVITIGMPIVIFLAVKAYHKYYVAMPLPGRMEIMGTNIIIEKMILSDTFHRYIEVWKSGMPLIESIILDEETGAMAVKAMLHVEAYTRKWRGGMGNLVAADSITRTVDVKVPEDKMEDLKKVLHTYYSEVLIIKNKGDVTDGKTV